MRSKQTQKYAAAAAACILAAGVAVSVPASAATDETDAYCAAVLATEEAFAFEDPDLIESAVDELLAVAPDEITDAIETAIEFAEEFSPEFDAAYATLIDHVRANCDANDLEALATDYAFGGIPDEVPSGLTIVTLVNEGDELHEILLLRRNDDFDDPVEALFEMSEEEGMEHVSFAGVAFAMPGATGYAVVDLEPGEYIAICFVPVGTTLEVVEAWQEMEAAMAEMDGTAPHDDMDDMDEGGPPHAVEGMVHEFTVVDE